MKKMKILLLGLACLTAGVMQAQLKTIGDVSYYQLPTKGLKYERVDAYVTLDQSRMREMAGKLGSLAGSAANEVLKDITEVYDSWPLCPPYIKTDKGAGVLKLNVTYVPDDLRRPMTAPPVNQQRGGHVVPYKVFASMKLTDPAGKVLMERNYGELSGEFVSHNYITAAESKEGIGTYEMACIRAAMLKAQAEVFGMYGFGLMKATIEIGPVKEIKESKKAAEAAINVLENKKGFVLTNGEKETMKAFVDVVEKNIGMASDKTRWIAYHNLAVGYTWLQDEAKAKQYFAKEMEESKESIELVRNFGKKGSKGYNGKDLEKFQSYTAIEEFVNYYVAGANKYPELLSALSRPLKQFSDYYTQNDLLNQIYGLDFFYQFLPFNAFKGSPKSVKGTISQEGRPAIEYSLSIDKKGNPKELEVKSVNDAGDEVETKEIQPIFNKEGDYVTTVVSGIERLIGPSKYDLRRMSAPVNDLTTGEAGNIMKGGFLSNTNEKNQMLFDLKGVMYFKGNNDYATPNAFFSKFLAGGTTKFGRAKSNTDFTAITQINENGEVVQWKWDGKAYMGWGLAGDGSAKNYVEGTINRDFKVINFDEHGLPKSINVDSKTKAKLVAKEIDWKKVKDQYSSYNNFWATAGKPKINASATGFDATSGEVWPCEYTLDDKGNWTSAKIGPYTIKREFKY